MIFWTMYYTRDQAIRYYFDWNRVGTALTYKDHTRTLADKVSYIYERTKKPYEVGITIYDAKWVK